uniref:Rac-like GTP-binding protein 3 n=1 Tax=Rhizophora mucronata TaxID=61149 RepID=A0A2P2J8A5_RHIMU
MEHQSACGVPHPLQWSQAPIQGDQPSNAYLHGDLLWYQPVQLELQGHNGEAQESTFSVHSHSLPDLQVRKPRQRHLPLYSSRVLICYNLLALSKSLRWIHVQSKRTDLEICFQHYQNESQILWLQIMNNKMTPKVKIIKGEKTRAKYPYQLCPKVPS